MGKRFVIRVEVTLTEAEIEAATARARLEGWSLREELTDAAMGGVTAMVDCAVNDRKGGVL
jgi:hypothetical protein